MTHHANNPRVKLPHVEYDPAHDFGVDWIDAWTRSENYRIWEANTDSHLFDIVEPKHPCAGGLTIDDVQRRIAEQVRELGLDERFAVGKEAVGKGWQVGREKAGSLLGKLYADMEGLREAQRRKAEEAAERAEKEKEAREANGAVGGGFGGGVAPTTVQTVQSKAGAYIGSWGSWVGEKRKTGWGKATAVHQPPWVKKGISFSLSFPHISPPSLFKSC